MGIITAIKPQRRRGRYNIMVDESFAIAVSEKVLVDLGLSIGKHLDENNLREVATAEDASKALTAALRLLEVRPRSEHEIDARLTQHGYCKELTQATIEKLRGYGYVDDQQFTDAWIESRSRSQPAGKQRLKFELAQKGVSKETVDLAVSAITEDEEIALATKAISKKSIPSFTSREEQQASYQRDAGYLARRGFGWSIVKAVLKKRYGKEIPTDPV